MASDTATARAPLDALSREVFERGVRYCLPSAELTRVGDVEPAVADLSIEARDDGAIDVVWLGAAYRLEHPGRGFTESEMKLLRSIGRVLSARYRLFLDAA